MMDYAESQKSTLREKSLVSQLQTIIDNFSGGLTVGTVVDDKIRLIYANDEFYSMFGYTREEFEGKFGEQVFNVVIPDDRQLLMEKMRESIEKKENLQMECRVRKQDGTIIWVRGRNSVCHMESTQDPVNVVVYNDITKEREAQARIRSIDKRFENSEVFLKLNVTEQIIEEFHSVYVSDKAELIPCCELSYEDMLLSVIFNNDKKAIFKELSFQGIQEHYANGDVKYSVEYRRILPSGETKWFVATVVLMEGISSETVNAYIYAHDIDTRMKQRIARNRIIDTDVDDITIIHIANHAVHVVQFYNGSTIESGEGVYEENLKRYIADEVAQEDRQGCQEFFQLHNMIKEINKQGYADHAYWIISPSGSNRRKNAHVTYLDSTGEDLLMVGRDITSLFEQEQEQQMILRQAVDLANFANEAKSDFLSRMSHDMRAPLNAVLGLVDLVQKENQQPALEEYLRKISNAGQYLLSLVNDTLDLSKIESGNMEFHEECYPIEDFIDGIHTVIKPLMDAKNIEFVMRLDRKASNIVVDKLRFNQVFYNLLSNAAKYTPEGGRVVLFTEPIPERNGKFGMRFHVCDNGIGMSKKYLKVLFEPFTQENRAEVTEQKGTGLGLAIVKKIVDLTGGSIRVISEIDNGTEFIVDLYAYNIDNVPKEHKTSKYDINKLRGIRVLMVDDSEVNMLILSKLLELRGCVVHCAESGRQALSMFAQEQEEFYDIVITDLRMPEMDGFEVARQIRAQSREDAKNIPIIAVTADAYGEILDKIREAEMNARLVKPIEADDLYSTIVELL